MAQRGNCLKYKASLRFLLAYPFNPLRTENESVLSAMHSPPAGLQGKLGVTQCVGKHPLHYLFITTMLLAFF